VLIHNNNFDCSLILFPPQRTVLVLPNLISKSLNKTLIWIWKIQQTYFTFVLVALVNRIVNV